MEILSAIGILIAAVTGFLFGKKHSSSEAEKNRLEQELKAKTAELDTFHSKVNTHFEKTAELFNHVSDSYQSLYDHMAKSSTQLCASQTFQALPKTNTSQEPVGAEAVVSHTTSISQSDDLFDADHLYQAHEYRNHQNEQTPQETPQENPQENIGKTNKVVEIASVKESQDAQALDYAIKGKGVINHNSLDMDGVKNS